jgi:hypothetical protein
VFGLAEESSTDWLYEGKSRGQSISEREKAAVPARGEPVVAVSTQAGADLSLSAVASKSAQAQEREHLARCVIASSSLYLPVWVRLPNPTVRMGKSVLEAPRKLGARSPEHFRSSSRKVLVVVGSAGAVVLGDLEQLVGLASSIASLCLAGLVGVTASATVVICCIDHHPRRRTEVKKPERS